MTVSMSRFQKYIVCGVFYILYWCYCPKRSQNGPILEIGPFWSHLGQLHKYGMQNTPQTIYFWNLLIDTVILSYKTLKSNNFEN